MIHRIPPCRWIALGALALSIPLPLAAQLPPDDSAIEASDTAHLEAGSVTNAQGRIAVNVAAGSGNQQIGDAIIAIGGTAVSTEIVRQSDLSASSVDRSTRITLDDGAIAGNTGMLSVNVTAGSHNQSANLAQVSIATHGALSDQLLEQSRASIEPARGAGDPSVARNDSIVVGDAALSGNSGLAQINLVGGERNSSANLFQLNVSAGATE